jgi:hypothetical protein
MAHTDISLAHSECMKPGPPSQAWRLTVFNLLAKQIAYFSVRVLGTIPTQVAYGAQEPAAAFRHGLAQQCSSATSGLTGAKMMWRGFIAESAAT